ncbi:MAG: hypothetical protein E5Y65_24820 [Mesorhizobium sp.]|jgi:hypothetical protein|nr:MULTISPECIES: hypothetical protein [Mesorhizobium]RWK61378.1 MAG: hypothetical protein EOR49_18090 [Mesorhizobium sp.]RWM45350.1 MAG: hypothetical protein EOR76_21975 [Mesorhizobium sp.]RWM49992.1 MAG: hypothetical protein EOR79_30630 [Mesorhizobium sp.]RWM51323.1 MAG: hypothetical protein EOR78_24410 [Mesorhizobium sp.]RWM96656.1 MAG: hypothetical protein EOR85_21790 [Mesorhizobium sp.]
MSRKTISISSFAGMIAASLWALASPASSGSLGPMEGQTQYLPIQSISYEFGSKFMSGYFVQEAATCFVALMIIEKSDPEAELTATATRVRLVLNPGQIAGVDSEEGYSVNLTCGMDATTLLVDVGARDKLVALQALALPDEQFTGGTSGSDE